MLADRGGWIPGKLPDICVGSEDRQAAGHFGST